jgi:hypothetical protein
MTDAIFPGEVPPPRGPEMVFHDPFSHDLPPKQADIPVHSSPKPQRVEGKRTNSNQPATRAAAIEAVVRDLKLLALSKGISALESVPRIP